MVLGTGNILSPALNQQLVALQQTARDFDAAQLQLSTGKRVNFATDNPQNFFESRSLTQRAGDLSRLLDGISQSVGTVQVAENALEGIRLLVNQAEFITRDAKATLLAEEENISDVILENDPLVYYKLDEASGAIVNNSGANSSIIGQYFGVTQETGSLHFSKDSRSIRFDGVDDYINIPNNALINTDPAGYPERTVELTFNADTTAGRQVLFKAGGTGNAFNIYIEDGSIYFVARDSGDFGPFNISAEIEANETYHAAFVFDSASSSFKGFLNGELVGSGTVTKEMNRHGGAISIGRSSGGSFYHDGPQGGTGNFFSGRMSDFALYNDALTQDDLKARFEATQLDKAEGFQQEVIGILSQIDSLVEDAGYRGVNLLADDDLITHFNEDRSSNLEIKGKDFSYSGLGFSDPDFTSYDLIDDTISNFEDTADKFKEYESSLASKLNVIEARQEYTLETISTLQSGSDDLVVADQNTVGAELLALGTRQQIQSTTLALSRPQVNIADLLSQSSIF